MFVLLIKSTSSFIFRRIYNCFNRQRISTKKSLESGQISDDLTADSDLDLSTPLQSETSSPILGLEIEKERKMRSSPLRSQKAKQERRMGPVEPRDKVQVC